MKKYFGFLSALLVASVAMAAVITDDQLKVGKKAANTDKEIVFDTGNGTSNKKIKLIKSTKQLQLTSDTVSIGNGASGPKALIFDRGGSNPEIRWNESLSTFEFAKDGASFKSFGSGSGSGGSGFNILDNSGFEDGSTNGWTNSGGTYAEVTSGSNLLFETKSVTFDASSSGQYFESDLVDVPVGLQGGICEGSVYYLGGDTNLKLVVIDGSAAVIAERAFLDAASKTTSFSVLFSCPTSGQLKLRVESTGDAAIAAFDKTHLGEAKLLSGTTATPWRSFTPSYSTVAVYDSTITAVTKATTGINVDVGQWRRNGENLEMWVNYNAVNTTGGSETAGIFLVPPPTDSGCVIDTTKVNRVTSAFFNTGAANYQGGTTIVGAGMVMNSGVANNADLTIYPYNSSYFALFATRSNAFWSTTQFGLRNAAGTVSATFKASVPCQGWSTGVAAAPDQTDYGWTDYTPASTQGFGTTTPATNQCQHMRIAQNIFIQCRMVVGTVAASEARISLPGSLVTATSSGLKQVGTGNRSDAVGPLVVLAGSGLGYLNFANAGGSPSTTALNGNGVLSTGATMSFFAGPIAIAGWVPNQRAPTLLGSVTSNALNAERIERLIQSTACSASPCTPNATSSSWAGATYVRTGAGAYTITTSGWTALPSCVCNYGENSTSGVCSVESTSTTSLKIRVQDSAFGQTDKPFHLMCMGPR